MPVFFICRIKKKHWTNPCGTDEAIPGHQHHHHSLKVENPPFKFATSKLAYDVRTSFVVIDPSFLVRMLLIGWAFARNLRVLGFSKSAERGKEEMKDLVGRPGSVSGLLLRLGQCAFAASAIGVMVGAYGFSTFTAFWYFLFSFTSLFFTHFPFSFCLSYNCTEENSVL